MGNGKSYCKYCKKGTNWEWSKALENTWFVHGDFPGDYSGTDTSKAKRGQTMSKTGPAKLVTVRKCKECGRSVKDDE